MSDLFFFGYGANKNRDKINQIIGRYPDLEFGAILEGYQLVYQNLEQIPDPAQSILRKLYGSGFKAYTLKQEAGIVAGNVWQITEKELEAIKEWEFVGTWRELIPVSVKTAGNKIINAVTEKSSDKFSFSDVADGLSYDEFGFVDTEEGKKTQQFYTTQQINIIQEELQKISKLP